MYYYVGVFQPAVDIAVVIDTSSNDEDVLTSGGLLTNWTLQSGVLPSGSGYTDLCFAPELNMFVGISSTQVIRSTDHGLTWASTANLTANSSSSIAWSPTLGKFILCPPAGGAFDQVRLSPDGEDWSENYANPGFGARLAGTCWATVLGKFLVMDGAVNNAVETKTYLSSDGQTWNTYTPFGTITPGANKGIGSVCWSEPLQKFCAVSNATGGGLFRRESHTSSDGQTWTSHALDASADHRWSQVIYASALGRFVTITGLSQAVGASTSDNTAAYSSDGASWTLTTLPYTRTWSTVVWNGKRFAAFMNGGPDSANCATSADGITWASQALTGAGRSWRRAAAARNVYA